MIRVSAEGPRIRIWCNRMHPSVDPEHGLRIDFTDRDDPIPAGAIGVHTLGGPAMFDDIVVLPVDALTDSP